MSLNKVMLIGNVGKDPEVTSFDGGGKVAKFTLATSERYTDKSGNKTEKTEWHNVVAWGPLADLVEKYVVKGKLLYLEGQIRNRSWEQDGVKKFATDINITNLSFLGSNNSNGSKEQNGISSYAPTNSQPVAQDQKSAPAKKSSTAKSAPAPSPAPAPSMEDTDDDLPF